MLTYASGAAYLDRTGAVLAADPGFLSALSLPAQDPSGALRACAEGNPGLRALLAGEGPDVVRLEVGGVVLALSRHGSAGGALLLVRTAALQDWLEQGQRSMALTRVVAGVAHDIKNPLNAMALQLAILSEKLGGQGEVAAGPHLDALREQVGRVNEVVRRFLDVVDPAAPLGYVELGAMLGDVAGLFAHEARRRRIQLVVEPPRGVGRAEADPARLGRLLLVLLAGAMAATPDGGRVEAGVESEDGQAILRLSHALADGEQETGYEREVLAEAASGLGASLTERREEGVVRVVLRLSRVQRA